MFKLLNEISKGLSSLYKRLHNKNETRKVRYIRKSTRNIGENNNQKHLSNKINSILNRKT